MIMCIQKLLGPVARLFTTSLAVMEYTPSMSTRVMNTLTKYCLYVYKKNDSATTNSLGQGSLPTNLKSTVGYNIIASVYRYTIRVFNACKLKYPYWKNENALVAEQSKKP